MFVLFHARQALPPWFPRLELAQHESAALAEFLSKNRNRISGRGKAVDPMKADSSS
jgi:hypothetical protein